MDICSPGIDSFFRPDTFFFVQHLFISLSVMVRYKDWTKKSDKKQPKYKKQQKKSSESSKNRWIKTSWKDYMYSKSGLFRTNISVIFFTALVLKRSTKGKHVQVEVFGNKSRSGGQAVLTTPDVNLRLAGQKAAVPSLLLTTVQGGLREGVCRC